MDKFVYSEPVVEFMTVAVQTCVYLEQQMEHDSYEKMMGTLLRLLPVLYVKTLLVPEVPVSVDLPIATGNDDFLQAYCSEEDYNNILIAVNRKLGNDDAYISLPVEGGRYDDIAESRSISEDIADIYQALKDMASNYQTHNEQVMHEAISECIDSFRYYWGRRLLDAVHALHVLEYDIVS